jgi:bifunctional ADP-heptose synthase (sugar kinase/adenylyltransferase)
VIFVRGHAGCPDRCAPSRCAGEGADYRIEEAVGADLVQCYGGAVVLLDLMVRLS